jgi:hypothetical protein
VKRKKKNTEQYYTVMNLINVLLSNEMHTAVLRSYLQNYPMINDFQ